MQGGKSSKSANLQKTAAKNSRKKQMNRVTESDVGGIKLFLLFKGFFVLKFLTGYGGNGVAGGVYGGVEGVFGDGLWAKNFG